MGALFLVMTGGALGAGARYGVGLWAVRLAGADGWPLGTLVANVGGGLAMGMLAGLAAQVAVGESARLFVGVGLLGGFTTFSAFSLEVFALIERGQWASGLGYALVSVIGAVAALALGYAATRALAGSSLA